VGKDRTKKPGRFLKFLIGLVCVLVLLCGIWTAFSLIGRINPDSVIPGSAFLRVNIAHPLRMLDRVLSHEPLHDLSAVPELASSFTMLKILEESPLLKNRLLRLALGGTVEFAMLQTGTSPVAQEPLSGIPSGSLILVWDMGLCSPLLRVLPLLSGFVNVPNLYYVQAGKNSCFEYRTEGKTFYIGPFRNLLYITDNSALFESRSNSIQVNKDSTFSAIKPSSCDAALLLTPDFFGSLLAEQDASMAAILKNMDFDSPIEAGFSLFPKKLELRLATQMSSGSTALSRLLEQRSSAPVMAERLPSAVQYATILSAGTLEELYQAALVFSGPDLENNLRRAESSSRLLLGLNLQDLLFSWSGKEFTVFGMEGRPYPVYAIQIGDERKRQEVFDKAFKSIVLNENVRLNLDGTRIPRIEVPEFLQSLLRQWNLILPSPYYIIHQDYLLVSESAETLLAAMRAMQQNDVLPRTAAWRNIAGGKAVSSAFSVYYSLDLSMPFFLRGNTALSGFFRLYRQGYLRMNFDKGFVDLSLALIPGSGGGVMLVSGYPLDLNQRNLSNQVHGAGMGADRRVFLSAGSTTISMNPSDNSIKEFSGQGQGWIIPSDTVAKGPANIWVVTNQGRVTLINSSDMEPDQKFPILTGLRLSSPPEVWDGRLYLCDQDGKVHSIDTNGIQETWDTSFFAALRSPPSFISISAGRTVRSLAAVYPKTFFGEIWLLDTDGKVLPNWPASLDAPSLSGLPSPLGGQSSGIGFGSPLLFERNNRLYIAFISQAGEFFIFDENAAFIPPFPLILNGVFFHQPVFDGEFLWLISSDGTLFQVSLEGQVLSQRIPDFSVKEEGYITVFDCDGDKVPEIFITGEGNALHGYSRNFRSLEGFPLPVWGKPLFTSGSGKPEVIGIGMDRRLYRWQFK
jgi:hypothetical protein